MKIQPIINYQQCHNKFTFAAVLDFTQPQMVMNLEQTAGFLEMILIGKDLLNMKKIILQVKIKLI